MIRLQAWLETNKKNLMYLGGSGLAVILIVIGVLGAQSQKEANASQALSDVEIPRNLSAMPDPGTADKYLQVAKDYAGTKAAGRALLLSGSVLFMSGDYEGALNRFKEFQTDYPDSPWYAQSMYGVAASLDAQKKSAEAIAAYEDLRRRFAAEPVSTEAKLNLARIFESENRLQEAYTYYEELIQANQGTGLGAEAGMRRQRLVEKHPELVPVETNIPPALLTPNEPLTTITNAFKTITNAAQSNLNTVIKTNTPPGGKPPIQLQLNTTTPGTPKAGTPAPGQPTGTPPEGKTPAPATPPATPPGGQPQPGTPPTPAPEPNQN